MLKIKAGYIQLNGCNRRNSQTLLDLYIFQGYEGLALDVM